MSSTSTTGAATGGESDGVAVVTGASSGIGRAFAERLAADGRPLIVVGRNRERLDELAERLQVDVEVVVADLADAADTGRLAALLAEREVALLVNNAGVAHYGAFAELPAEKADELMAVKITAPTLLARAVVPGMLARGAGAIINVAGMLAYSGPAPLAELPLRRAVYVGANAHLVALSQTLDAELRDAGIRVQVLCPGVVATEFHERQGMDLSAVPRMSPEDVAAASLRGLELGEVVTAPGVEDAGLLDAASAASMAAFRGQSPELASRYRA
ncbi:SDR family NAD(P)-dependent oxidoreductase [Schumannella soli]|uniref:SDR family NAD(P)-dependent oxidoreductase n=1 Tax=Schumannella soli TaxID=2590779 RepID=A0A506XPH5_9MICO|nr:SDR family NAD(P)-dependent oxidoreductase [Schumannella soli]TPW74594.1 SDR family NAD(P)-dependent oxidoreductase [Schumannella soli]